MVVWNIAYKNIKSVLGNLVLLPMLIGMPIFQIIMMTSMLEGIVPEEVSTGVRQFTEIVVLSTGSSVSYSNLFAASTLVQFLLIAGIVVSAIIVDEKKEKTLMRTFAAPVEKIKIILGNVFGQLIIMLAVAGVIIAITNLFLGIQWGGSWLNVLLVALLLIYVSIAMGLVFSAMFKDAKLANGIMSFVIIIMTFLSGGFTFSENFDTVSKFTINKWAFDALGKLMEGSGFRDIALNLGVLGIVGTVLILIASVLYRRENVYE